MCRRVVGTVWVGRSLGVADGDHHLFEGCGYRHADTGVSSKICSISA
jgi:hypothetical protein